MRVAVAKDSKHGFKIAIRAENTEDTATVLALNWEAVEICKLAKHYPWIRHIDVSKYVIDGVYRDDRALIDLPLTEAVGLFDSANPTTIEVRITTEIKMINRKHKSEIKTRARVAKEDTKMNREKERHLRGHGIDELKKRQHVVERNRKAARA